MAKFIVSASELVFYQAEVEASSIEEVDYLISLGDVEWGQPIDGTNFEVLSIVKNIFN